MGDAISYKENFYAGADYGLNADYGKQFSTELFPTYRFSAGAFGIPTDPRSANQLKAVSDKLNTGAKTIEVSGITAATWETVPEHHLEEIYRLKKLVGSDLTFHGPLIDPTGFTRQGWDQSHRTEAERQMWQSVERAHKMDPKGNLLVTFHSSNGLPDAESMVMQEVVNPNTGKKEMKEVIKDVIVISRTGQVDRLNPTPNYLKGDNGEIGTIEQQKKKIAEFIDKQNKDTWYRELQGLSYHAYAGASQVKATLAGRELDEEIKHATKEEQWLDIYRKYLKTKDMSKALEIVGEPVKPFVEKQLQSLEHGDLYLRDAYQMFQRLYNSAYEAALKDKDRDKTRAEDLKRLEEFRSKIGHVLPTVEEPENLKKFGDLLLQGVDVLRSIEPPKSVVQFRDFAVDQSSETFANIAFNAYKNFKDSAPVISVENPPAGGLLSRGKDLRDVVQASRKKLSERLMKEQHLSPRDAEKQAEKLIGVTWDVGHINMIKKHGYDDKQLVKETEEVGKFINKIHLSDNFGMEHTELPMGMGNVPTKEMFEIMKKYNSKVDQVKKIIETGNWFGPQGFGNTTPFAESLRSFGSPIYSMKMSPYWNQAYGAAGGYFTGYGQTLPEQHFSMYGAGFSNMPKELGGQLSGRSRVGGTPME